MLTRRAPLNDVTLRNLPAPAEGVAQHPDGKIAGMGVRVTAGGVKSFFLEYRLRGSKRRLSLGRYPVTTLQKARTKALAALVMIAEGKDPSQPDGVAGQSFPEALAEFVGSYCNRHNRPSTAAETERLLRTYFLAAWEKRTVDTITRADVADAIEPMMKRGTHAAARHAFAAVRKFFNWQVEQGRLAMSPCAGMKPPAKASHRDRVLSDAELKAIWTVAEAQGFPFGRITQLLMLTAQRRTEVSSMTWEELDLTAGTWTIPAERTKNGKPHAVPLTAGACAVIARIPRTGSAYVFPARGKPEQPYTGWSKGKRMLDDAAGLQDWTLHDLRRTAATGMARAGIAPHVVERVLNHVSGTFAGVAGVYNRFQYGPEMRAALETWERHVLAITAEPAEVRAA
jgi:integrase